MKKLSVTIGIPTSFAGDSLIKTARTIYYARKNEKYLLKIYADNTPISASQYKELRKLDFEINWTPGSGSFLKKARKLIAETNTDLLILTQDDIIFDSKTIEATVETFTKNPKVTMVSVRILPLQPENWFEAAIAAMVRFIDRIAHYWNGGDNYLAASGRYLAFRTKHLKKLPIPEVVNGDMYLYLANIKYGGKFTRSEKGKVFIRCPQKISDQLNPSSRFQYSKNEMEKYFSTDLSSIYHIPIFTIIRALIKELLFSPISLLCYFGIFIYTRLYRLPAKKIMKTQWKPDTSTKKTVAF